MFVYFPIICKIYKFVIQFSIVLYILHILALLLYKLL
nr:MAG TPA: hypothetical protein [Caudoviricetes sp.]